MSLNQVEPAGLRHRVRLRWSRGSLVRLFRPSLRRSGGRFRFAPARARAKKLRCPRFGLFPARAFFEALRAMLARLAMRFA